MSEIIKIAVRPHMKRPILYRTVTKSMIILVLALLWERYINNNGRFPRFQYSFTILGLVTVCLSWFSYLAFDGLKIHHLNEKKGRKPKKKHKTRDIADFIDEKIISFDELEREEQIVCNLLSTLLSGLIFIILSLVAMLLKIG